MVVKRRIFALFSVLVLVIAPFLSIILTKGKKAEATVVKVADLPEATSGAGTLLCDFDGTLYILSGGSGNLYNFDPKTYSVSFISSAPVRASNPETHYIPVLSFYSSYTNSLHWYGKSVLIAKEVYIFAGGGIWWWRYAGSIDLVECAVIILRGSSYYNVLTFGGIKGGALTAEIIEGYDNTSIYTWTTVAYLPRPMKGVAVKYNPAGSGYVIIGGCDNTSYYSDIYIYENGQITKVADLPSPRAYAAAREINGKIYIFGGKNGSGFLADILEFDPATYAIRNVGALPSGRSHMAVATFAAGSGYSPQTYLIGGLTASGAVTDILLFAPPPPPPAAPTLSVSISGYNNAVLTWTSVAGATSYIVERSTDGVNFTQIAETSQTTYTDPNLSVGVTYYYRVKAKNESGTSPPSNVVSVTISPLSTPTLAGKLVNGAAYLWWQEVTGATSYVLEKSVDGTNFYQLVETDQLSYTDTGVSAGNTYYYRMRAKRDSQLSDYSNVVAIYVLYAPQLSGTLNGDRAELSWTTVERATSYLLERSLDGVNFSLLSELAATSYVDPGLQAGRTYWYRVQAKSGDNTSAYSNVVSLYVPRPAILRAYWPEGGLYVRVEWNRMDMPAPEGMAQLWRKDSQIGTWMPVKDLTGADLNSFVWDDTNVTASLNYAYQVRVYNPSSWQWSVVAETGWATGERPLAAPAGLRVVSRENGTATVTWKPVEGATSYQVQVSTDGGTTWQTSSVGGPPATVPRPCLVRVKAGTHARSQWSSVLTVN